MALGTNCSASKTPYLLKMVMLTLIIGGSSEANRGADLSCLGFMLLLLTKILVCDAYICDSEDLSIPSDLKTHTSLASRKMLSRD